MKYSNPVINIISNEIKKTSLKLWDISIEDNLNTLFTTPPKKDLGDICFPCFILSKLTKEKPNIIADKLSSKLGIVKFVKSTNSQGPYLNIFFNTQNVAESLIPSILDQSYFKLSPQSDEKIMVEYSQPNTHKDLHVGHMRNLCLGNAIVRMNRYASNDITSATYPGDSGTHVAKCLQFLKKYKMNEIPKENKGQWLSKVYIESEQKFQSLGEKEKEDLKIELGTILTEIHDQKGEYYSLWQETREWSINLMKEVYAWANVDFDQWFFESVEDAPSVEYINKLYEDGKLQKNDGAIGIDLSEDKLKFCLLLKSNGTGLYSTKDIMLAKTKFENHDITQNIYIVDDRQSFHFKQIFKTLEKLKFPYAKNCYHLPYAMVELPSGAMSSRKGKVVLINELIEKMQESITQNYLSKYKEEWSSDEIKDTAKKIANAAIKYGMLRVDNNRKIVFDMDEWLKLDGETGPYLLYVVARINSIESKIKLLDEKIDFNLLQTDQEKQLLNHLNSFNETVISGALKLQTIHVCSYLYNLAKLYNSFYAECSILKAPSEELKHTRLALTSATKIILTKGLSTLGIDCIERM